MGLRWVDGGEYSSWVDDGEAPLTMAEVLQYGGDATRSSINALNATNARKFGAWDIGGYTDPYALASGLGGSAEDQRYWNAGADSQELRDILNNYQNTASKTDDALAEYYKINPAGALGLIGQRVSRSGDGGPDQGWFVDKDRYYNGLLSVDGNDPSRTAMAEKYGIRTPENIAIGNQWQSEMSPGAQSKRNDPDEGLFGGGLGTLIALGGLAFGLPPLLEGLGAAGGFGAAELAGLVDAGYLSAADAAMLSSVEGFGTAAAAAGGMAAGDAVGSGGGMGNWFTDMLSSARDTVSGLFGNSGVSEAAFNAADAAQLAQQGLSSAQIADVMAAASSVSPEILSNVASMASQGVGESAINSYLTASGVSGTAASGLSSALNLLTRGVGAGGTGPNILGTGANLLGGYLNSRSYADSSRTLANAQLEAARMAAEAAKFKPFGIAPTDPRIKAQQGQIFDASQGLLNQFTGSPAATAQMGTAANRMMTLGNQYLGTDPAAQAQKYMNEQQALLTAPRETELAGTLNRLQAQGRGGLMMGGTSNGQLAANPELNALYNARRQQDLGLAANATQGGMDYAKFGAGLVGGGGNMLRDMYGTQTAAAGPWNTALGMGTSLEGDAGGTSARILAQGTVNAAQTMAPANANSTWGNLLSGAGNMLNQYGQPQPQQQQGYRFDPYTGRALG